MIRALLADLAFVALVCITTAMAAGSVASHRRKDRP